MNKKSLTHNGRFGTMAAVSPQTILWEIVRYYPAASSVLAARRTVQRDNKVRNWTLTLKIVNDIECYLEIIFFNYNLNFYHYGQ